MLRYAVLLALLVAAALWFVLDGPVTSDERVAPAAGGVVRRTTDDADLVAPETRERRTNDADGSEPLEEAGEESAAATPAAALDPSRMRIVVLDANGAPVAGAHVETHWRKGWGNYDSEEAITDASGVAPTTLESLVQFEGIDVRAPDGERTVTDMHEDLVVDPDEPTVVRVAIGARQTLSIRVLDLGGRPVPNAAVELEHGAPADLGPFVNVLSTPPTERNIEADDAGRIELDVDLGTWRLDVVGGTGLGETYVDLDDAGGRTEAVVRALSPADGRPVHVEVVGGEAGRRIDVMAIGRMAASDERLRVYATRDDDGSFELRLPREGAWIVHGSSKGFEKVKSPLAADVDRVRLVLVPEGAPAPLAPLVGRVVSAEDGSPLRATVTTTRSPSIRSRRVGPGSRFDGDFELPRPQRGGVYIQASSDGYVDRFMGPIGLDDLGPFEVRLDVQRRIAGRVVDASGQPVLGMVNINLADQIVDVEGNAGADDRYLGDFISTGLEGEFRFRGVSATRHRITVLPMDKALPPALVVASGGDEDVVVTLGEGIEALGTLRGRVVDAVSGAAVAGVHVRVFASEDGPRALSQGLSDSTGAYAVHGVPPGRYDVIASPDPERVQGYTFARVRDVELLEGETTLDVEILRARRLHVKVVDSQGRPVRRVGLAAEDSTGRRLSFQDRYGNSDGTIRSTDAAGRAVLTGLPATQVVIHVLGDDREPILSSEIDLTSPRREVLRLVVPR